MRGSKAKMFRRVAAEVAQGANEQITVNVHQKMCGTQRVVLQDGTSVVQPVFHEVHQVLWAADSPRCMYKQMKRGL
jgi:hypothetical protein